MKAMQTRASIAGIILCVVGTSACQTARKTNPTSDQAQNDRVGVRHPAGAEETVIDKFVQALAKESSLGGKAAVEDAVASAVHENAAKLKAPEIRTFDDINSLSEAEQKKLVQRLANLPGFAKRLEIDSLDAVGNARAEAMAAGDIKNVAADAVPDIRAQAGVKDEPNSLFAKALERNPALKDDVALMVKEDAAIEEKTGIRVLAKGCDKIESEESVQNLATIENGVSRDVASGPISDAKGVSKSLEKNTETVLGTDEAETHRRICVLSDENQCAVFNKKMCTE